jgi:enoyl-[acyl-carrier protein] reductase I
MGFLAGKRILITGLISNRSIAYGIAKACHREGAELAFTYQNERFKDRMAKFADEFGSRQSIPATSARMPRSMPCSPNLAKRWDGMEGLVHSIAFAPNEAIEGDFLDGLSRESFRIAHDISSYSYPGAGQGRAAAAAEGKQPRPAGAELPRRRAHHAQLQHHGPGQGQPRSGHPLSGILPRSAGHPRQRALGGTDQDAGGIRHWQLRQAAGLQRASRAAAPQCHHRGSRQCRRLPALRPGQRHHRRSLYVDGGTHTTALGNPDPLPG